MTTSVAPLLPKLRGNFAEFLNKSSPDRLRIFFSSTCVGLRYGYLQKFSSFSRQRGFMHISFLIRLSSRLRLTTCVLHYKPALPLEHTVPFVLRTILLCHCIELLRRYWNINQLSIIYAFQPQLRSRLTLGGRTFPRKPQTFDGGVSRSALATYAGILSCMQSTTSFNSASARIHCSSTNHAIAQFLNFGVRF